MPRRTRSGCCHASSGVSRGRRSVCCRSAKQWHEGVVWCPVRSGVPERGLSAVSSGRGAGVSTGSFQRLPCGRGVPRRNCSDGCSAKGLCLGVIVQAAVVRRAVSRRDRSDRCRVRSGVSGRSFILLPSGKQCLGGVVQVLALQRCGASE